MKRYHLFLLLLVNWLTVYVGTATAQPVKIPGSVQQLPSFKVRLVSDSTQLFTNKDLAANTPLLISYIEPGCGHCAKEILDIRMAMDSNQLGNLQVLLVAARPRGMKELLPMLQLAIHPRLHCGWEENFKLADYFGLKQMPSNAWYNAKGELVHEGEQDFNIIKLKTWLNK